MCLYIEILTRISSSVETPITVSVHRDSNKNQFLYRDTYYCVCREILTRISSSIETPIIVSVHRDSN